MVSVARSKSKRVTPHAMKQWRSKCYTVFACAGSQAVIRVPIPSLLITHTAPP